MEKCDNTCPCGCDNPPIKSVASRYQIRCEECQCWRSIVIPKHIPKSQESLYARIRAVKIHKISPIDRILEYEDTGGWHSMDCKNTKAHYSLIGFGGKCSVAEVLDTLW